MKKPVVEIELKFAIRLGPGLVSADGLALALREDVEATLSAAGHEILETRSASQRLDSWAPVMTKPPKRAQR